MSEKYHSLSPYDDFCAEEHFLDLVTHHITTPFTGKPQCA